MAINNKPQHGSEALCGGSLFAPLKDVDAVENHSGSRTKSATLIFFIYSKVKILILSNNSRITKDFVYFFGGLRPRPSKRVGFVYGKRRWGQLAISN